MAPTSPSSPALERARRLVALLDWPGWPATLVVSAQRELSIDGRLEAAGRAAEIAAAGEPRATAELAAAFEVRARHALTPALERELEGPSADELEREADSAERSATAAAALAWWRDDARRLIAELDVDAETRARLEAEVEGGERYLAELVEGAPPDGERCAGIDVASEPDRVAVVVSVEGFGVVEVPDELAPLFDGDEADVRAEFRGWEPAERHFYRELVAAAKARERGPLEAARWATRQVLDERVARARAGYLAQLARTAHRQELSA